MEKATDSDSTIEGLAAELKKMSLKASSKKGTGFVYHPDMLRHAISEDDAEVAASHVENPGRLKAIVSRFDKLGLLPRLDVVKEFGECSPDLVKAVHPEPFFDYVDKFWDKNEKRGGRIS